MVWYSNPKDHSLSKPWTENRIALGPDVLFTHTTAKASGADREIIVTAEYFNPRVRIFWTEDPKQDWSKLNMVRDNLLIELFCETVIEKKRITLLCAFL